MMRLKAKTIIVYLILILFAIPATNSYAGVTYQGTFPGGKVSLTYWSVIAFSVITSFTVTSHINNCNYESHPFAGLTGVSVNWASFNWTTASGGSVHGILAPTGTYVQSYVGWTKPLQANGCKIPVQTEVKLYPAK